MDDFKRHPALDVIQGKTPADQKPPNIEEDIAELRRINSIVADAGRWRELVRFILTLAAFGAFGVILWGVLVLLFGN